MEEREATINNNASSFGLKQHEASSDAYPMDPPRPDNPNPFSGPPMTSASASAAAATATVAENNAAAPQFSITMPAENASSELKKKRGRPRKYNLDGTPVTLSPMPISSSVPLTTEYPPRKRGRGRGKSNRWLKKSPMFQFDRSPGNLSHTFFTTLLDNCLFFFL